MFLALGVNNIKKSKYDTTLIVGNSAVWTYKDKRWFNLTSLSEIEHFNWEEFNVFSNNEKIGNYYLWYSDEWYLFDKEKNAINIDGDLFAYQANHDINILSFTEEEITDDTYVNYVLQENDLSLSSQFTTKYKLSFDFDNDGEVEDFYVISNAFPLDFDPEKVFSFVFMVKNDYIYYLYNDISSNRSFNGCKPFVKNVLDVDNDNIYEMILGCGRYSVSEEVDMLYKFIDDSFKIVISNQ